MCSRSSASPLRATQVPLLLGTAVVNGVRRVAHAKRKEAAAPDADGNGGEEQVSSKPSKPYGNMPNPTSPRKGLHASYWSLQGSRQQHGLHQKFSLV